MVGVNFALFSAHATKVELCLFDHTGTHELERIELPEYTDEIWHGYLPDAHAGQVYGYRVYGAYEPEAGHRFNHHKLLIDPYAKQLVGELKWSAELFGYTLGSADADLSFDKRDSAAFVPKAKVIDSAFTWGKHQSCRVPPDKTIIYETHVRGFTKCHPNVPENLRGTFAGLTSHYALQHIRSLGVTSIELLPIQAFVDDRALLDRGLKNYWGYNSIAFFAPHTAYLANGHLEEFKEMVARLHAANLEVILDVAYNQTAEGNELGPTLSMRGIDNCSYYQLKDNKRYYTTNEGSGNTLDLSQPVVVRFVTDSLRYWATEMGIDGFRFDLGSILAKAKGEFDQRHSFHIACRQDPILSQLKLISEPWKRNPGEAQAGVFPPGWYEWNKPFHDCVRSFWRGDENKIAELANRFCASGDLFNKGGRRPASSINFVASHDGLTLADAVSYEEKHNEANGEKNKDGYSNNFSCNYGMEGESDNVDINLMRMRHMKNLMSMLLLSQGTPMIVAGDEFGRTQQGNDNAYCQDNEISWLDWNLAEKNKELLEFTKHLIRLRNTYPALRRARFPSGKNAEENAVKDVIWLSSDGMTMSKKNWDDKQLGCLGILLDSHIGSGETESNDGDTTILLILNAKPKSNLFMLPEARGGKKWTVLIDTSQSTQEQIVNYPAKEKLTIFEQSLLMLALLNE